MRVRSALAALFCACASGQVVMAHPGHAHEPENAGSLSHYLMHPDHLAQWLIVGIVATTALLLLRARKSKRLAPAYARKR